MSVIDRKKGDEALLMALACGATVENAALKAGVSARTAHRRLTDPAFCHQLERLRAEMVERTVAMLSAAGSESVRTLLSLQSTATPPAVRLGAARAVLDLGLKMRGVSALEEPVDQAPPREPWMMSLPELEQHVADLQHRLCSVRRMTEAEKRMNDSIGQHATQR